MFSSQISSSFRFSLEAGVGLETCYELVRHGARVFLGARSQAKFDDARKSIESRLSAEDKKEGKPRVPMRGVLTYLQADVSTVASARRAAQAFLGHNTGKLDILVLCAGLASSPVTPNNDGIEPLMATNCVNQVAMLRELQPLLVARRKSSQATVGGGSDEGGSSAEPTTMSRRIIFVSSVAHRWGDFFFYRHLRPTYSSWENVNDARRSDGLRYSQSKLAQILVTKRLQWEMLRSGEGGGGDNGSNSPNDDVACLALHPGEINNEFVTRNFTASVHAWTRGTAWLEQVLKRIIAFVLLDTREGARTCLFAATSREVDERRWRCVWTAPNPHCCLCIAPMCTR